MLVEDIDEISQIISKISTSSPVTPSNLHSRSNPSGAFFLPINSSAGLINEILKNYAITLKFTKQQIIQTLSLLTPKTPFQKDNLKQLYQILVQFEFLESKFV